MKIAVLALLTLAGVIDLNQASLSDLQTLPGVGAKKAQSIVQFREQHPFRRATEILRVRGIGQKLYQRIKEEICAGAACNHASAAAVPIGP